ncbi:MAG: hypothetical protein ACI861_000428 [Paracoccaceae bacterium]|jgi:hypothetical protein
MACKWLQLKPISLELFQCAAVVLTKLKNDFIEKIEWIPGNTLSVDGVQFCNQKFKHFT